MLGSIQFSTSLIFGTIGTLVVCTALHYITTILRFASPKRLGNGLKVPPLVPHILPILGSVPYRYFTDPIDFLSRSKWFARTGHPVRVKLFTKELYIVQGAEHVVGHLSQTSTSNTIFNSSFLAKACKLSSNGVARFENPVEEVPSYRKRNNYLDAAPLYTWSSAVIHDYLSGKSALLLFQRFESHLRNCIEARSQTADSDNDIVLEDLEVVFSEDVNAALVYSMCGAGLIEQSPGFLKAFATFCNNLPTFMKGTPKFMAKNIYDARDECVNAVIKWQAWATSNYDDSVQDKDGNDPYWGTKFFRERYENFVYDMGFDPSDVASVELGFLFGANANATANTYWSVIEVFKDKTLLEDIRAEAQACAVQDDDGVLRYDINQLLQQPILCAVFAENLRLRTHNMYIRKTMKDINIVDWYIPRDRFVIAWTTPGHMDSDIWCKNDAPPVDMFWPGRFLESSADGKSRTFSTAGVEGSWIPFGHGANICPGRHYAKVHCLLTIAMMVESFDCEILAKPSDLKPGLDKFGMGVLSPAGKVRARLKPRKIASL